MTWDDEARRLTSLLRGARLALEDTLDVRAQDVDEFRARHCLAHLWDNVALWVCLEDMHETCPFDSLPEWACDLFDERPTLP